jgi:hypothetical protein
MTPKSVRPARPGLLIALFVTLMAGSPPQLEAHEIPTTVLVQSFIRPDGDVLRVLVRVPLNSMRDFLFPTRGPGYLNISEADPMLYEAARMWIVDYIRLYEDGNLLTDARVEATRLSLPSDVTFQSYESALNQLLTGEPIPESTELYWEQALLDVLIEYPIASENSRFSLDSELAHLGIFTTTVLRFQLPGSDERLYQFSGLPGLVELDPSWFQAAFRFVRLGFLHILEGIDHLLFIFCLVIPFRRFFPLVAVITSFTIAHSITLIASALGFAPQSLWFPPLVEVLIALSILYMAVENIMGVNLRRRWLVAFGFGLVHGFGFSFMLRESLQYAGGHLIASLLAFNVGVELGQILILLLSIPVLGLLFRHVVAERMGVIVLSTLIAHTSWHWMADRWSDFRQFQIIWPTLDAIFLLHLMRWLLAILLLGVLVWVMFGVFGKIERWTGQAPPATPGAEKA